MSKIIDLMPRIAACRPRESWTKQVPESATLIQLCNVNSVSTLELSNINTGDSLVLAYFVDDDEWVNVYQKGTSINGNHLFFWVAATEVEDGEVIFREMILDIMKYIISDDWVIEE